MRRSLATLQRLLAVDPAEVAVPTDGNNVGEEHPVRQGHVGEVDKLNKRPDHPVGLERRPPSLLEPLLGAGALHGGHAAQEHTDHDGRKEGLVTGNAGERLHALVPESDVAGKEAKPRGGHGAKDACAIQEISIVNTIGLAGNVAGENSQPPYRAILPVRVMALDSLLLDELLGGNVASSEKDGRRHALRQQRTGSQPGVVP
ncbi:LOW QUALITY PROTEIN: hypothetical protein HJFPF1_01296 [Paramyrothecium foliicola]|nr:LOW QUALITY PROTEIN: hypothetical protein HJFPF1_01296 [Paramyrothecium foliicola]